jgi:uncharacterized protein (DUF1778 family)
MSKTEMIKLRLSAPEKDAFEKAAELSGIALSAWVRERLRRAAVKDLGEAGQQIAFLQSKLQEGAE